MPSSSRRSGRRPRGRAWPSSATRCSLEDGHTIELDVYAGALSGLIVAEVEFDDPWGAESFVAPYWFGREVTDDPAYKNQRLALAGRGELVQRRAAGADLGVKLVARARVLHPGRYGFGQRVGVAPPARAIARHDRDGAAARAGSI